MQVPTLIIVDKDSLEIEIWMQNKDDKESFRINFMKACLIFRQSIKIAARPWKFKVTKQ